MPCRFSEGSNVEDGSLCDPVVAILLLEVIGFDFNDDDDIRAPRGAVELNSVDDRTFPARLRDDDDLFKPFCCCSCNEDLVADKGVMECPAIGMGLA